MRLLLFVLIVEAVYGCMKDDEILNKLFMDGKVKNRAEEGHATEINTRLEIADIHFNSFNNGVTLFLITHQSWMTDSFSFGHWDPCHEIIKLEHQFLKSAIWLPDKLVSINRDLNHFAHPHILGVTIHSNGGVHLVRRIKQELSCTSRDGNFPFSSVNCSVTLANEHSSKEKFSLKFNSSEVEYHSSSNNFRGDLQLHQISTTFGENEINGKEMEFFEITIQYARDKKRIFLLFFLPSVLFMSIAWLSLVLGPMAITRSILIVSSIMLLLVHYSFNMAGLPSTPWITSIDLWKLFSIFYVFLILVELSLITCMASVGRSRRITSCCQSQKKRGKYSLEPLYEELNDLRARKTRRTCGCCRYTALIFDFISLWFFGILFLVFSAAFCFQSANMVSHVESLFDNHIFKLPYVNDNN